LFVLLVPWWLFLVRYRWLVDVKFDVIPITVGHFAVFEYVWLVCIQT
jgi:hypothetical protein